jgi:hypothetical protein
MFAVGFVKRQKDYNKFGEKQSLAFIHVSRMGQPSEVEELQRTLSLQHG